MFRRKEVIVIRERRRMSGVQMLATGVAMLGLLVAAPQLLDAVKQDFAAAQAQTAEQATAEWCTPARVQAGLCAPSLVEPARLVRVGGTTDCRQDNGNLVCTVCKPDKAGNALACHTERR